MEKEVILNFLFLLTNDILSYLQRCNLESLGESKTKTIKENKLTPVSGSIWNGNAYVGRGMHVCTSAITRAWLETWSGQAGAAFLCQTLMTAQSGSKTTAIQCAVMYQSQIFH